MLSSETVERPPSRRARRDAGSRLRQCLVSREAFPVDELIRFVVGPDQKIVPDIDGRLPGRGLWLKARRDIIESACDGRSFAKAARVPVVGDPGLANRVESLLLQKCLSLIGLARRSSNAVAGFEKVGALLKKRRPALLLCASDGGEDGRRKILSVVGNLPVIDQFSGSELGQIFGREKTVYAAVTDGGLAASLQREAARLKAFRATGTVRKL